MNQASIGLNQYNIFQNKDRLTLSEVEVICMLLLITNGNEIQRSSTNNWEPLILKAYTPTRSALYAENNRAELFRKERTLPMPKKTEYD